MAEATISQTPADTKASKRTLIKEMFAEMDRLHAQMKQDREESARLSVKIRANLDEIEVILNRISAS